MELFELAPDKIEVTLDVKRSGREFKLIHNLRPPSQADWIAYDKSLSVAIADVVGIEGGIQIQDNGIRAACTLWDAVVIDTVGYFGPETVPSLDLKAIIAPAHKQVAIKQLLQVSAQKAESDGTNENFFDLADLENKVLLRATRGAEFSNLIHHFRAPSVAQRILYDRVDAETIVVRGTKSGQDRIVVPPQLQHWTQLYDELIESTEGYSLKGIGISVKEDFIRHMDAQHKRAAIRGLFGSGDV